MSRFTQGRYKPKYPSKYRGDVKNIIYRSGWEMKYLFQLDMDHNVLEYSSEEIVIPYQDHKGNIRRYFPDMWVRRKVGDQIITELIEIKPYKETVPPVLTEGKKTKTKIKEILTWDINQRKWASAKRYCEKKGWIFRIIDEYELGLKKRK